MAAVPQRTLLASVGLTLALLTGAAPLSAQDDASEYPPCPEESFGVLVEPAGPGSLASCSSLLDRSRTQALVSGLLPDAQVTGDGQFTPDALGDASALNDPRASAEAAGVDIYAAMRAPVQVDAALKAGIRELGRPVGKPGQYPDGAGQLFVWWFDAPDGLPFLLAYSGNLDRDPVNDGQYWADLRDIGHSVDSVVQLGLSGQPLAPNASAFSSAGDIGPYFGAIGDEVAALVVKKAFPGYKVESASFGGGAPVVDFVEEPWSGALKQRADGWVPMAITDFDPTLVQKGKMLRVHGTLTSPLGPDILDGAFIVLAGDYGPNRKGRWKVKLQLTHAGDGVHTFDGRADFRKKEDAAYIRSLEITGWDRSAAEAWFGEQVTADLALGPFDPQVLAERLAQDLAVHRDNLFNVILTQGPADMGSDPRAFAGDDDGFVRFRQAWHAIGGVEGDDLFDSEFDIDGNGRIDALDLRTLYLQLDG